MPRKPKGQGAPPVKTPLITRIKIHNMTGGVDFLPLPEFDEKKAFEIITQIRAKLLRAIGQLEIGASMQQFVTQEAGDRPDDRQAQGTLRVSDLGFEVRVRRDRIRYGMRDIMDFPRISNELLKPMIKTVLDAVPKETREISFAGMQFVTILHFKERYRNTAWALENLMSAKANFLDGTGPLGKIDRVHRLDMKTIYQLGDDAVVLEFECPGNDDNSTLWMTMDYRTLTPPVSLERALDFERAYNYYTTQFAKLVETLVDENEMDLHKTGLLKR